MRITTTTTSGAGAGAAAAAPVAPSLLSWLAVPAGGEYDSQWDDRHGMRTRHVRGGGGGHSTSQGAALRSGPRKGQSPKVVKGGEYFAAPLFVGLTVGQGTRDMSRSAESQAIRSLVGAEFAQARRDTLIDLGVRF